MNRVEVKTLGRPFQKLYVSLLSSFQKSNMMWVWDISLFGTCFMPSFQIWGKVVEFEGSLHYSILFVNAPVPQHNHARQAVQSWVSKPHNDSSKLASCVCGKIAESLSGLIIKLLSRRLVRWAWRSWFWSKGFFLTTSQKHLFHCAQWSWCYSSFQFMEWLSLDSSWVYPEYLNQIYFIWSFGSSSKTWRSSNTS